MATFNEIRLQVADFLNIKIIGNQTTFFLNFWHIIHFISGAIVMFFILKLFKEMKTERKFVIFLTALVLYEFFELSLILSGSVLFRGETAWDVFLDLVLGSLGGFLFFRLSSRFPSK